MKKVLALAAVLIMVMAIFTGCGNKYERPDDCKYTGADMLVNTTWAYGDGSAYIRINGNKTYDIFDAEKNGNGKVCFWDVLEDDPDTIVLYNETYGEEMTLNCIGTYEKYLVTDDNGDELTRCDEPMNGKYYCAMDYFSMTKNGINLCAQLPCWVSDLEVISLKEGDMLDYSVYDADELKVEKLEKKSDDHYAINGKYNLKRDADRNAWLLTPHGTIAIAAGTCQVTDDTVFTDTLDNGAHKTIGDCLNENETVYANVVIENGSLKSVEMVDVLH